jgi:K+-sensing histidine kinase KdpD
VLLLEVRGSVGLDSPLRSSGIGLPVVRLPIEAMGDRVELADHHGDGDDFHLLLPQPPGDQG